MIRSGRRPSPEGLFADTVSSTAALSFSVPRLLVAGVCDVGRIQYDGTALHCLFPLQYCITCICLVVVTVYLCLCFMATELVSLDDEHSTRALLSGLDIAVKYRAKLLLLLLLLLLGLYAIPWYIALCDCVAGRQTLRGYTTYFFCGKSGSGIFFIVIQGDVYNSRVD